MDGHQKVDQTVLHCRKDVIKNSIPYFLEKTSRLLFISALPQCGDYSMAATIRSTDVAATIYFSSTAMRRLFEGGYYLKYRRRSYYIFQLYRNAATIRGRLLFEVQTSRLLFISALSQCGDYSRATIRGRLLFEVQTSRLLFISALPQCGDYSRAVTIQGAAFIRGNMVIVHVSAVRPSSCVEL